MSRGDSVVAEAEDAGGDAPRVNLACAAARWPVGLGCEVFPLVEVRRGQKLAGRRRHALGHWADGHCGVQGRAGDLGAIPGPSPGTQTLPLSPHPEILSGRSLTAPLRLPGVGGCHRGDSLTLLPRRSPCSPFRSPLEPKLRHFVFLNRSHLHTTFSFIKNTAELGEDQSSLRRGCARPGSCAGQRAAASRGVQRCL